VPSFTVIVFDIGRAPFDFLGDAVEAAAAVAAVAQSSAAPPASSARREVVDRSSCSAGIIGRAPLGLGFRHRTTAAAEATIIDCCYSRAGRDTAHRNT
jgi:hypothetical protein